MSKHINNLILDSRDQTNLLDGTPTTDAIFALSPGIYGLDSIELLGFQCPLTMYNVNATNNKIYFFDGTARTATMTPGNYSMDNLIDEVKRAMEVVSLLTFTVTYSYVTMKITIVGSSAYYFAFSTTLNSAAKILGFNDIDTSSNVNQIAPNVVNLSIPIYINAVISEFGSGYKSTNDNPTFSFFTNGNNSDVLSFTKNTFYSQIIPIHDNNIQMLHVKIMDHNNQLIDLNGAHWCMTLKLNYKQSCHA